MKHTCKLLDILMEELMERCEIGKEAAEEARSVLLSLLRISAM